MSKRRAKELKTYRELKMFILGKRPYCEMPSRTGAPTCLNPATEIHHVRGRYGPMLNDTRYWIAICDDCHKYLHEHANEARKLGVLK